MNRITYPFQLNFVSLKEESQFDELPIKGKIPCWLTGTLLRIGPGKFEAEKQKLNHLFDGLALLHKFSFHSQKVSYANKFLKSRAFRHAQEKGTIGYREFATDPCRSIFQKFVSFFSPEFTDNANVNVTTIADRFVALTETPLPIEFDPKTLETTGVFHHSDHLHETLTTAHPHYDFVKKEAVSYLAKFSFKNAYHIYRRDESSCTRNLVGTIPVKEPGYIHSFALTERYVILVEYPFLVNPLRLFFKTKPFIENFEWKPSRGTRFFVLNRNNGDIESIHEFESFFAFHHINAFEDRGDIVVDLAAYQDSSIIQSLYLDVLRGDNKESFPLAVARLKRYRLTAKGVRQELMPDDHLELPRINYRQVNMRDYRFLYAVGADKNDSSEFLNRLLKIDVQAKKVKIWRQEMCYPGEPVFVPSPETAREDDGVVLSVVLNAQSENSFLLILDANSFEEIARAEVPHHIPLGFHGQYYPVDF